MTRIKELEDLISKANQAYWVESDPIMEDVEYDKLVRELKQLDPSNKLLDMIGAGAKLSAQNQSIVPSKVKHDTPLLSLDKVYSLDELMDWIKKVARTPKEAFVVQIKYDGITCDINHGILSTRGDGEIGENITDKAPIIQAQSRTGYFGPIDKLLKEHNKRRIGELVILDDDFKQLNASAVEANMRSYKNQRNAVAGIVGVKDLKLLPPKTTLTFIEYGSHQVLVNATNIEKKWNAIVKKFDGYATPKDGLVIKLVDQEYSESLGSTAHHPRGQIAFKFANVRKPSKIVDIEWTVGKEAIVPTAIVEPVDIGGITINRATLHNFKNIVDNRIAIGDHVVVERSGDVIPWISTVQHDEKNKVVIPGRCPVCGSDKLEMVGPHLFCRNDDCPGKAIVKIEYALKILGVLGIGEACIAKAVNECKVTDIGSWMRFGLRKDLRELGFGEAISKVINTTTEQLLDSKVPAYKILASLSIPDIGENIAEVIMSYYPNIMEIVESDDIEQTLLSVPKVGPSRAKNVAEFMKKNRYAVSDYIKMFEGIEYPSEKVDDQKPTVCFTGEMEKPRQELMNIARSIDWKPVDAVSKGLDYLVVPNTMHRSSKVDKAMKYGVDIITYDRFVIIAQQRIIRKVMDVK